MEQDYKKMYLEQKLTALQMEMQLLQNRFGDIQQQLKKTQVEYDAYSALLSEAIVTEPEETEPVETKPEEAYGESEETEPVETDIPEIENDPDGM